MRERLITLACAVGALALFLGMFFHEDSPRLGGRDVSRPTTEERRANGYFAAMQWLDREHVRTVSLRDRYDKLATTSNLPPSGNLLVVTLPAVAVFKTEEFRPLDRWVRQGNTLWVVAALSDTPDWAFSLSGMTSGDLNLLTGLEFETARNRDSREHLQSRPGARTAPAADLAAAVLHLSTPHRSTLVANREHAFLAGVRQVTALSDFAAQPWTVKVPYEGFVFALGHDMDTGEGALWVRPLGQGTIVVSALGSILTNRALGLTDNARLLANVVASSVAPGGAVLFDDVHQGVRSTYDPARFYADPRLHLTMAILALLWLSWVLGSTRLRVPVVHATVPREADLVRATGGFLARVLTPAAAARRLLEHFLRRWPLAFLEQQARIAPADLALLRNWYAVPPDSTASLKRLQNLLVKLARQLNS